MLQVIKLAFVDQGKALLDYIERLSLSESENRTRDKTRELLGSVSKWHRLPGYRDLDGTRSCIRRLTGSTSGGDTVDMTRERPATINPRIFYPPYGATDDFLCPDNDMRAYEVTIHVTSELVAKEFFGDRSISRTTSTTILVLKSADPWMNEAFRLCDSVAQPVSGGK